MNFGNYRLQAAEWREEQRKCLAMISQHQDANQTYLDEGIRLLELAQKAGALFRKQSPAEKRRLLGFVLSNCTWKDGQLTAAYRQPFDLLAKNVIALETKKQTEQARTGDFDNWLPVVDAYRTLCITPTPEVRVLFRAVGEYLPEHASVRASGPDSSKTLVSIHALATKR